MTSNQFQFFESQELCSTLKASGLPQNTQREIVSRPASQLGLNNSYIYSTQGRKNITSLMNFYRSKCIRGLYLRESIEGHKLKIGCKGTLLSKIFPSLVKCVNLSWITKNWQFIKNKLGSKKKNPKLNSQVWNDSHIMEDLLRAGIKGEELAELKICWILLQDTCPSDNATGDGKKIYLSLCIGKTNTTVEQLNHSYKTVPHQKAWETCQ